MGAITFEFVFVRKKESNVTESPKEELVRWAVIVTMGRVVVEAETDDAAREKVERKGYTVLDVNRDNSSQALSF